MTNEALFAYAQAQNCRVEFMPLPVTKEVVIPGQRDCIGLDTRLSRTEEKELTAHALGHCMYGGYYGRYSKHQIREKAERRADKWAFTKLIPVGELRQACKHGLNELWEIAEYFDVSNEFAARAVACYQSLGLL